MRLISLSLLALIVAGSAHADLREGATTTIEIADHDLNTETGAREVLNELEHQIREACYLQRIGTRTKGIVDQQCVDEFLASAIKTIDSPALARVYGQKTKGRSGRSEQ